MSRTVYKQLANGEYLSNKVIDQALKDYKAAETALFKLGIPFEVSRKAISLTVDTLTDIQSARKR